MHKDSSSCARREILYIQGIEGVLLFSCSQFECFKNVQNAKTKYVFSIHWITCSYFISVQSSYLFVFFRWMSSTKDIIVWPLIPSFFNAYPSPYCAALLLIPLDIDFILHGCFVLIMIVSLLSLNPIMLTLFPGKIHLGVAMQLCPKFNEENTVAELYAPSLLSISPKS